MKRLYTEDFAIIPVDKHIVDVFTGDGWTNWSRFHNTGNYLKLVKGKGVNDEVYAKLMRLL
jgi:hypothetical protein